MTNGQRAGGGGQENARQFNGPLIIAHRGASADAPENTPASFHLAWQQGADAIEGDFRLTSDERIVCVHDADLARFGHNSISVADSTLAELRQCDVGSWKSAEFAGARIPTLARVLALVPAGKHLRLEIKAGRRPLSAIADELRRLDVPADRVRLMSFDADVVREAKTLLPAFKADWLLEFPSDRPVSTADAVLATLRQCRADGLGVEAEPAVVTPGFGRAVRAAGFDLGVWTVNNVDLARQMIAAGATAITTDRPGELKNALVRS